MWVLLLISSLTSECSVKVSQTTDSGSSFKPDPHSQSYSDTFTDHTFVKFETMRSMHEIAI